jgi:hypothetical protein
MVLVYHFGPKTSILLKMILNKMKFFLDNFKKIVPLTFKKIVTLTLTLTFKKIVTLTFKKIVPLTLTFKKIVPLTFKKIVTLNVSLIDIVRVCGIGNIKKCTFFLHILLPKDEVEFLYELSKFYITFQKNYKKVSRATGKQGKIFIHFPVWGERYTEIFLLYAAPSLLAPGNLPFISKTNGVELQIFCDSTAHTKLLKSKVYTKLQKYASVTLCPIPQKLFSLHKGIKSPHTKDFAKYLLYGTFQSLGALKAIKEKGYISFLNADIAIGQNAFSNAVKHIAEGKDAVLTNSFRSNIDTMSLDLNKYIEQDGGVLSLPHNDLVHLQVKHIHPAALRRVVATQTQFFDATPQMIFYDGKSLIGRSLHYHPFLVSGKLLGKIQCDSGFPIDGDLPIMISKFKDKFSEMLAVIEDAAEVGVLELSPESTEPAQTKKQEFCTQKQLFVEISNYLNRKSISPGESYLLSKCTRYDSIHKEHIQFLKNKKYDIIDDKDFIQRALLSESR